MIEISINEKESGSYIISLAGSLDAETQESFEEKIKPLLTESTNTIIFDMKRLNYISSVGIGAIFSVRNFMEGNKKEIFMLDLQPQIKKVLEVVKAIPHEELLSIKDVDEYLAKIQRNVLDQEREQTGP